MGPGILPETTVGRHNPQCHMQMLTKAIMLKWKPYVNMVQKRCCDLWAKAHLKFTVSKWKIFLWSDVSRFDILVINYGRLCPPAWRGGRPSSVSSAFSSKASISDGTGVYKCIQYDQLSCFRRHNECWNVNKGIRATYAPLQMTSISAGQCKTTFCSYCNSMA